MLVLSRKEGQKIILDNKIVVEVVRVQGNRVTLGIAAPVDIKILRGELQQPKPTMQTIDLEMEDGLLAC